MGYDMYREDDGDYFRLNVWGMGNAREQLCVVGIVSVVPMRPFPRPEQFGLPSDYHYSDDDVPETPVERSYRDAVADWTDAPVGGDTHGIPSYKLCTNDGWLVTPGEIRTGVAWADRHHPGWRETLTDFVLEFVEWLEGSPQGVRIW